MRYIAPLIPALTVALLVIVAVLPWGATQSTHFFLPLLPLVGVHYWVVRRAQLMPVLFVFGCGLLMDGLTSGPLGLWSLIYMVGYALASLSKEIRLTYSGLGRWAAFACTMVLTVAVQWAVSSVYFARLFDWWPLAIAVGICVLVYPVIAAAFWPVNRIWSSRKLGSLSRGN